MAQDAKEAVAVEAAKVVAAPLSEQVTAIGTILSDEAVTVSSEIPGTRLIAARPSDSGTRRLTRSPFGPSVVS